MFFKKVTALKLANIISERVYVNAKTPASPCKIIYEEDCIYAYSVACNIACVQPGEFFYGKRCSKRICPCT